MDPDNDLDLNLLKAVLAIIFASSSTQPPSVKGITDILHCDPDDQRDIPNVNPTFATISLHQP